MAETAGGVEHGRLRLLAGSIGRRASTFRRSCSVLGVRYTLRAFLAELIRPENDAYDDPFDTEWESDTAGAYDYDADHAETLGADATGYEGTRVDVVRHAFSLLPVDPSRTDFVDIGSGKGRVAMLAAQHGFRRVVGIELNEELHDVAVANLAAARPRLGDADIELHRGSALDHELPDGPLVVFMFNPFTGRVFADMLTRLEDRARRSAEPLWLVYVNPIERTQIEASDRFEAVAEEITTPYFWSTFVYRSTTPG